MYKKTLVCAVNLLTLLFPPGTAHAETTLQRHVFGSAGGLATADSLEVGWTLGQGVGGNTSSTSYELSHGFWSPTETDRDRSYPDDSGFDASEGALWGGAVNTATGNFTISQTDFVLPGRGPTPLVFKRTYNSRDLLSGPLGAGWRHSFMIEARTTCYGGVLIIWDNGNRDLYRLKSGVYEHETGNTPGDLTNDPTTGCPVFTSPAGTRFDFDEEGRLSSITDRNGESAALSWTNGTLEQISQPNGRSLWLAYAADRLTTVTDHAGRCVSFSYNESQNLTTCTDLRGEAWTFSYDDDHRMLTARDPVGNAYITNEYDNRRRVTKQTDALDHSTTFTYLCDGSTNITDRRGFTYIHTYDGQHRLTAVTDPLGRTKLFDFDEGGNMVRFTDADGRRTVYEYGESDRLTRASYPDHPDVPCTAYVYDSEGRLREIGKNGARVMAYEYDDNDRVTLSTDVFGNTVGYQYGDCGRLAAITYPGEKCVFYQYDSSGDLASITDWQDNFTTFSYNNLGDVVEAHHANGTLTSYAYDAGGNILSLRSETSTGSLICAYECEYDAVGNLVEMTSDQPLQPTIDNRTTTFTYDGANQTATFRGRECPKDACGNIALLPFDEPLDLSWNLAGRLTAAYSKDMVSTCSYDTSGNRIVAVCSGINTRYILGVGQDGRTAILGEQNEDGEVLASYIYGQGLLSRIDASGRTTVYHFDPLGNVAARTDLQGAIVEFRAYTPFGEARVSTREDPQPFGFAAQQGAVTDPNGLVFVSRRYYSPALGRFLNRSASPETEPGSYDARELLTGGAMRREHTRGPGAPLNAALFAPVPRNGPGAR